MSLAPTLLLAAALTSSTWRESMSYRVAADVGDSVFPVPAVGVTGGYYLKPDLLVEGSYAKGHLPLYFFAVDSEVYQLRLKKFWGNSFFTDAGLGRRTIALSLGPSAFQAVGNYLGGRVEATTVVAPLAIGNLWQWSRFSLGVDWLTVMLPVAKVAENQDAANGLVAGAQREKQRLFDEVAGGKSYAALCWSMGVSW